MTSAEFTESIAFEQLEPDPLQVLVNLQAQTLALLANVYRDPRRHEAYTAADFLPKPVEGPSEKEMRRQWNEALRLLRSNYAARQRQN